MSDTEKVDQALKEIFISMWTLEDENGKALREMFTQFFTDMEDILELDSGMGEKLGNRVRQIVADKLREQE